MKTYQEIRQELSPENVCALFAALSKFVLDHGYAKTSDDKEWQAAFIATQQSLPENLQPYFGDMLALHLCGGLK